MLSTAGEASPAASGQACWVQSAGPVCLQCPEGAPCHLHLFLPPSHAVHVSGLWMWGEKGASLAASCMDWEATCHPQALTFPERNCRMRSLLALSWVPLGAGWCTSSQAAPPTLSVHPNSQFWAPKAGWNFSPGSPDFSKALWSVGDCFRQCFPGAPGPRLVVGGGGAA